MIIIRSLYFLLFALLCILPQDSFADVPLADCETAIAYGIYKNLDKIAPNYTLEDVVSDAIFINLPGSCKRFNFNYGWNNVDLGNGMSIDWEKVKVKVIDKVNYDPTSRNYTFAVSENAWYVLGGAVTGFIIGSVVAVGAGVCAVASLGGCALVGLGAVGANLVTIGGVTFAVGTTAAITSSVAMAAITAQQIAISAQKLDIRKTLSDWDGCVNITDDGKTNKGSDLFTTEVIRPLFPDLHGAKFAFNTSAGNILFKDSELFLVTAEQKDNIINGVSKIADKGACDGHTWKLYLYPVRIFLEDIDKNGDWKFDLRMENDEVLLDG
jgi:hypothetical protein